MFSAKCQSTINRKSGFTLLNKREVIDNKVLYVQYSKRYSTLNVITQLLYSFTHIISLLLLWQVDKIHTAAFFKILCKTLQVCIINYVHSAVHSDLSSILQKFSNYLPVYNLYNTYTLKLLICKV